MEMLNHLLLGVCLSLFAMGVIEETIYSLAGSKFYNICKKWVSNAWQGALWGFSISSVLGRSSLIRLFAIGFVSTGAMALGPGLMLMLWADVGGTSLYFLVGISIGFILIPILGISGVLYLRLPSSFIKELLGLIFGISLFIYSVSLIKTGGQELGSIPQFQAAFVAENFVTIFNFIITFIFAAIITILTQSPVAITVILLSLLKGGAVGIEFIALCLYGVNFGKTLDQLRGVTKNSGSRLKMIVLPNFVKLAAIGLLLVLYVVEVFFKVPLIFALLKAAFPVMIEFQGIMAVLFVHIISAVIGSVFYKKILYYADNISWLQTFEGDLGKPKYIMPAQVEDSRSAVDMIKKEELRLLKRLPLYLDFYRMDVNAEMANKKILAYHEAFKSISEVVREYTADICKISASSANTNEVLDCAEQHTTLSFLEKNIFLFSEIINSAPELSKHTKKLVNNLLEALDAVLLVCIDTVEEQDLTQLEIMNTITKDKHLYLKTIREMHSIEREISSEENLLLLNLMEQFNEAILNMQKLAENIKFAL